MQCCDVCSNPSLLHCSKCYKVGYCSRYCQTKHWNIHKSECFPMKIETSEILGRHLVATRDIKQWELILKESPLLSAPSGRNVGQIICFGCYAPLYEEYMKCSTCKSPVCGQQCEKLESHANFECEIFKKNSLDIYSFPIHRIHTFVFVLRGLLLKYSDPTKWNILMDFQSRPKVESAARSFHRLKASNECVEFIRDTCHLTQFSKNEISQILGAMGINGFGSHDFESDKPRSCNLVYRICSMLSHSCVPNIYKLADDEINFELRASVDIKAGTPITTSYVDTWNPTHLRQYQLEMQASFTCSCERCEDPTEFGTYISGIRCSTLIYDSSCPGYFIPAKDMKTWKCSICQMIIDYQQIDQFDEQFQGWIDDVSEDKSINDLKWLIELQNEYEEKVHPNYHNFVRLEYLICAMVADLILKSSLPEDPHLLMRILKTAVKNCKHVLDYVGIVNPGLNKDRGENLYNQLIIKSHKSIRDQRTEDSGHVLDELRQIKKEALKILSVEYKSDARAMVQVINQINLD